MSEVLFDVQLIVNGVPRSGHVPARRLLSDFLRHDLQLTGTHVALARCCLMGRQFAHVFFSR
jgi:aerobic-type carbon monoxide dehydrogenase small subunit (CoxS/CutS family)